MALLIYVVTEGQTLLVHCSNILNFFFFLDVLLTVHLSIFILIINQLDAQNFCFTISLFQASTSFEYHVLIIRRSKLYYTVSGIITPLCRWTLLVVPCFKIKKLKCFRNQFHFFLSRNIAGRHLLS